MASKSAFPTVNRIFRDLPPIFHTEIKFPDLLKKLSLEDMAEAWGQRRRRARAQKVRAKCESGPAAPVAKRFVLEGELGPGRSTRFSIARQDFDLNESPFIVGEMEFGSFAKVSGMIQTDGTYLASSVTVTRHFTPTKG